ncbi:MAG: hypothetical protein HDT23_04405 [Ruminococcus sp.]|nr:hypothetical protein [Ruminococcus sp.]
MIKLKNLIKDFFISVIYAIIIHLISTNNIFNNFIISIVFDIIISELIFNTISNKEKFIMNEIQKVKTSYHFNFDLYDNFHSLQLNELKCLTLASCAFLPLSKKLCSFFSYYIDINKLENNLICETILLLIIVFTWMLIISILRKKFNKYYEIIIKRDENIGNKYMDIAEKYRIYVDNYTEEEIKILNDGEPLIKSTTENSNSENNSHE